MVSNTRPSERRKGSRALLTGASVAAKKSRLSSLASSIEAQDRSQAQQDQNQTQTQNQAKQQQKRQQEDQEEQQKLLDIIQHALFHPSHSDSLPILVQQVKKCLYDRDFARAFGTPECQEVYVLRWSAARALAYVRLFRDLEPVRRCVEDLVLVRNCEREGEEEGEEEGEDGEVQEQGKDLDEEREPEREDNKQVEEVKQWRREKERKTEREWEEDEEWRKEEELVENKQVEKEKEWRREKEREQKRECEEEDKWRKEKAKRESFDATPPRDGLEAAEKMMSAINLKKKMEKKRTRKETEGEEEARIVCLGGGAGAEMLAFAGLASSLLDMARKEDDSRRGRGGGGEEEEREREEKGEKEEEMEGEIPPSKTKTNATSKSTTSSLQIHILDQAAWSLLLRKLHNSMSTTGSDPGPASTSAPHHHLNFSVNLNLSYQQADLLSMSPTQLALLLRRAPLVTLLFTLNELYAVSVAATTAFLLRMALAMRRGALLLVVDSSGSYSRVGIGKGGRKKGKEGKKGVERESEKGGDGAGDAGDAGAGANADTGTSPSHAAAAKKYPMQWLLDHTLLGSVDRESGSNSSRNAPEEASAWEKIFSEDSRWCRLDSTLRYPLDLEDMRYQVHLYRHR